MLQLLGVSHEFYGHFLGGGDTTGTETLSSLATISTADSLDAFGNTANRTCIETGKRSLFAPPQSPSKPKT